MMKKMTAVWMILSGLFFSASAADFLSFSKIKIDANFYPAPVTASRGGGVSYGIPTKSRTANKWLMISIEYTPALVKESFSTLMPTAQGGQLITRGWQDNVVLSVRVLFNTGLSRRKKPVFGLFSGQSCFWSIRQDGQKHYVLMFVPAQLIDRYCISNNANGVIRPMGKKDFLIEAVFSCDGTVLGRSYCNLAASKLQQQQLHFNQMLKDVPADLHIENGVLPRSKTPWCGYYPDAFDLEKDVSGKK